MSENISRDEIRRAVENLGGQMLDDEQEALYAVLNDDADGWRFGCLVLVCFLIPLAMTLLFVWVMSHL